VSENFTQLLAGRSVQGIGGGGIVALGMVILTDIIPLRQRPIFIGIIQISWALGTVSGPLLGGLFAQYTTWRWIFYINFPFCGIGFVTVPLVMRLHANRPPIMERLQYVDWFGSALFIASTTSFLIGLTWGGSQYPWSSWRTLVPVIVGIAGFLAMVVWERYWAFRPFLRLELFNSYSAIVAYSCAMLQGLLVRHRFVSGPSSDNCS
jgi:MFS family permease